MTTVRNIQERVINAPPAVVGALLDRLGSDDDPLWPAPQWEPVRFDRPLMVGADGGHGAIRYVTTAYHPGRRLRFVLHPECGIAGYHEFTVEALPGDRCVLRHVLHGEVRGPMRLLWPFAVRTLHEALMTDLLDRAVRAATGRQPTVVGWSRWVRLWRWLMTPRSRLAPIVPVEAQAARAAFDRVHFADAWEVPLIRGMPTDPYAWVTGIFFQPPPWWARRRRAHHGGGLVLLTADGAGSGSEALLGRDVGGLALRVSVLVDRERSAVTVTTVARAGSWRARLGLVWRRRVHTSLVRTQLRRALHRFAGAAGATTAPVPSPLPWPVPSPVSGGAGVRQRPVAGPVATALDR